MIPFTCPVWPIVWIEIQLYSSITVALEVGEWSAARSDRTLPPWKTRYPFYRRLGGPQDRSGRAKNLIPTGNFVVVAKLCLCWYLHVRGSTDWLTFLTGLFVPYSTLCHRQPLWVLEGMRGVCCPKIYGSILSPFSPTLNESGADVEGGTIAHPGTFILWVS